MVTLFWLAFATAITGTFLALRGLPIDTCRVIVLAALGTAMGALVVIGSVEALLGIPLLGGTALVVALVDIDTPPSC